MHREIIAPLHNHAGQSLVKTASAYRSDAGHECDYIFGKVGGGEGGGGVESLCYTFHGNNTRISRLAGPPCKTIKERAGDWPPDHFLHPPL